MERVLEAKLLPPVLPSVLVLRPRLDALLAESLSRRLTAVVAPAGFGKSTLLAAWAESNRCAWYTLGEEDRQLERLFHGVVAALRLRVPGLVESMPASGPASLVRGPDAEAEQDERAGAHAAFLALELEDRMRSDLVLVLDDLHELELGTPPARFVEALCRQSPRRLHLVVLSRRDPPFPTARLRAQGLAAEITGTTMAFALDETAALVGGVTSVQRDDAVEQLQETTRGWPAAVRLGAEALRERGTIPCSPSRSAQTVWSVLADEVFDRAEPELAALIRTVAPLDGFTAALCERLGLADAQSTLDALEHRGLFLQPHRSGDGWYSLHPLVREFAHGRMALGTGEERDILLRAAGWLERAGEVMGALRCHHAAGDDPGVREMLAEHGTAIVDAGGADDVVQLISGVPPDVRTPALDQLEGEARHALGDWDGALECFERLGRHGGTFPAAAAWRCGLIHYQRGDLDGALEFYELGMTSRTSDPERALVLAWAAAAHWLRGDVDVCGKLAGEAFEIAGVSGDDRALAAAHTALAMVAALEGDRRANDAHYVRALMHAERAGDVMQLIRIRTNRGSRFVEEGEYAEALEELDGAIRMADLAGYASFRALALSNRGQALLGLGRLDEAAQDLAASRALYGRVGSRMAAYPLAYLGDVHRARGDRALARAAYEEAAELAEAAGDLQGLVPALSGLARVLVDVDARWARAVADRAAAAGPALGHPRAVLAAGWAMLAMGDVAGALGRARQAADAGRSQRDRATIAEALELEVMAGTDPDVARAGLEEARAVWRGLGNPLGEARTELAMARLVAGPDGIVLADSAAARFRAAGARAAAAEAASVAMSWRDDSHRPIAARVLGAFALVREGAAVGPAEWGSRKPRDLLKVLIARRGGPVRRDVLLDALWLDEDPVASSRKLSVALSTLRAIVDPAKQYGAEHFVAADRAAVWLVRDHWDIDLERFLVAAADGCRRHADRDGGCLGTLSAAEAMYVGDPFEEDAYEDWAAAIREESRTAYVSVTRALADQALRDEDHDTAVRMLLRLLERDPFDEGAHLGLVGSLRSAGRHGEARRAYRGYCDRMEEVGVEPAPFPSAPSPGQGRGR